MVPDLVGILSVHGPYGGTGRSDRSTTRRERELAGCVLRVEAAADPLDDVGEITTPRAAIDDDR
jgi:hypothetical protein